VLCALIIFLSRDPPLSAEIVQETAGLGMAAMEPGQESVRFDRALARGLGVAEPAPSTRDQFIEKLFIQYGFLTRARSQVARPNRCACARANRAPPKPSVKRE
jgi:hypothetical protein